MEENVKGETYDRDGWWMGRIANITKQGNYLVAFVEFLEYTFDQWRLHWDFSEDKRVPPPKNIKFLFQWMKEHQQRR